MFLTQFIHCGLKATQSGRTKTSKPVCAARGKMCARREDLDAYMANIHGRLRVIQQTESLMTTIFDNYDLEYTLNRRNHFDG